MYTVKWKMVRKAVDVQEATADQGVCAPWTRGNNCPPVEYLNQIRGIYPILKL
ncbi:possible endonuclease [Salmonella enterica subsp. houtenae]|nr:possible endonuclease [Salmonella enterica subsp. houtenae]VFS01682.1 possible endonuclease [Salmonella enterica subsp. houtenae]